MFSLWRVVKCSGERGHETCRGDGGNEKMTDKRKQGRGRRGRRGGNLTSSHCGALTRKHESGESGGSVRGDYLSIFSFY